MIGISRPCNYCGRPVYHPDEEKPCPHCNNYKPCFPVGFWQGLITWACWLLLPFVVLGAISEWVWRKRLYCWSWGPGYHGTYIDEPVVQWHVCLPSRMLWRFDLAVGVYQIRRTHSPHWARWAGDEAPAWTELKQVWGDYMEVERVLRRYNTMESKYPGPDGRSDEGWRSEFIVQAIREKTDRILMGGIEAEFRCRIAEEVREQIEDELRQEMEPGLRAEYEEERLEMEGESDGKEEGQ